MNPKKGKKVVKTTKVKAKVKKTTRKVERQKTMKLDKLRAAYAALEKLGYTPDGDGVVHCPKIIGDKPCTSVAFTPMGDRLNPIITSRSLLDLNKKESFTRQKKSKATRLWETHEQHIDEQGRLTLRKIKPSRQFPQGGRPSHDFMLMESAKLVSDAGDPQKELSTLSEELGRIVVASAARLDTTPLLRLIAAVELLRKQDSKKIAEQKNSVRRDIVMKAFQDLCKELQSPPSKKQLWERSLAISNSGSLYAESYNEKIHGKLFGVKFKCRIAALSKDGSLRIKGNPLFVVGGIAGTIKEMDKKQFTREFINPLGLDWLPRSGHW